MVKKQLGGNRTEAFEPEPGVSIETISDLRKTDTSSSDSLLFQQELIEQAEKSAAQFKSIVRSSNDAIISKNLVGIIQSWNAGAERLFGYSAEEAIGQPATFLMPEDRFDEEPEILELIGRGETVDRYETVRRRRDGSLIDISLTISPIRENTVSGRDDGRIIGASKIARDITARTRAEAELFETQRRFEEHTRIFDITLASITDFAYAFGQDGRFIFANRPLVDLLGISADEIVGKNFFDLNYPADLAERLQSQIQQVFRTGEVVRDETPFTSETGAGGTYEYIFSPIVGPGGSVDLVAGTTRDITARADAEKALRESEAFTRGVINSLGHQLAVLDRDGTITRVNQAWRDFANENGGTASATDVGSNYLEACRPRHDSSADRMIATIREGIESVLDGTCPRFTVEYPCHSPTERRWFLMSVEPLPTGGAVVSHVNITERHEAEAELRKSEEKYRTLFNSIDEGFCVFEMIYDEDDTPVDYRFLEVNPSFERQSGLIDAVGKTASELVPNLEKQWFDIYGKVARTGDSIRVTVEIKSMNRWLDLYACRVGGPGSRRVAVVFDDVSERKRIEKELQQSEERFRLMADAAPVLIWLSGTDKLCFWFNKTWLDFTGRSMEQEVGSGWTDNIHPDDLSHCLKTYNEAFDARERYSIEYRLKSHNGEYYWFLDVGVPRFAGESEFIGYIGSCTHINEIKKAGETVARHSEELEVRVNERTGQLAEATEKFTQEYLKRLEVEKHRVRVLRRLASAQEDERKRIGRDLHDQIGQQITGLRFKLAAMRASGGDALSFAKQVDYLEEFAKGIDADVSALSYELRPPGIDEMGIRASVGDFVKYWGVSHNIATEFYSPPADRRPLDPETNIHVYRIVQEALNNILKHASAKTVSVILEFRGDDLLLIIEDDGVGFDPDIKKKRTRGEGGLGLIGMQERCLLIGGSMSIESRPGEGTVILFRFPAKTADETSPDSQ